MAEIGWNNQPTTNQGATTQSTYPSANKPGNNPPPAQQQQQTVTASQPTVTNPNQPPPHPGDVWQGGAADPHGTQTSNGTQTGGRYVDPTYQTDATGRQLSPDEQAYWRLQDTLRAQRASIARSNAVGGNTNKGLAVDAPVYDPVTNSYSYRDGDGNWTHGVTANDIYGKLSDAVKKQYPQWYFGEYANQQQQTFQANLNNQAATNENFARMGQQTTRYAPTSF